MFFCVVGVPVRRGIGWLLTSLETDLPGFLFERDMVRKVIEIQEFYKSLIYFGFISINATFNQLTRPKTI